MKYLYRFLLLAALLIVLSPEIMAQSFNYDDIEAGRFRETYTSGVRSMSDGKYYTTIEGRNQNTIAKWSYSDFSSEREPVEEYFIPNVVIRDYQFNHDESLILIEEYTRRIYRHSYYANLYVYDVISRKTTPVTTSGNCREATFSPAITSWLL